MEIDKELDSNWEWGLDKIQQHKEEVKRKLAAGEKVTSKEGLKNIGRFGNELAFNPWGNAELLEKARSNDASAAKILKDLFNAEGQHLTSPVNSYQLSKSDTVHHWLAQRTGGDTVQNLSHPQLHRFHENLADSPFILGNRVLDRQRTLVSFMRGFHLDSDVLKGTEAAALNPLGATQAKDLNTPKAHRIAASNRLISGTHNVQDGADAFTLMRPQMALQNKHSQEAFDVMRPIQQKINTLVGLPGVDEGSSALERKELRQAITDNAPAVEALIRKEMSPLLKFQQTEVLKRALGSAPKSLLSALPIPVISQAFGAIDTAERTAKAAKTKDPLDATQATLAGAGMAPVVGNIADIANTAIDAVRWLANPLTRTNLNKGASKAFTGAHTGRY